MLRCVTFVGVLCASLTSTAFGAVQIVDDFGANGWYSWDTRYPSAIAPGAPLVGTNNTSPLWPATHTPAGDTAIAAQIKFMNQGVVAPALGGTVPASPTGSLGGRGYVRLDGTNNNNGKSDISYLNGAGIAAASALGNPAFTATYRYFTDNALSNRTPGLNIAMTNLTTNSGLSPAGIYTFNHVQAGYSIGTWNTETVDNTTSLFSLFGAGAPGNAVSQTLTQWLADVTWGAFLNDPNTSIFRIGFNVGSSQANGLIYMDWMNTNLLNGGNTIDFQGPAAVPEASSLIVWGLIAGMMCIGGAYWQRRGVAVRNA